LESGFTPAELMLGRNIRTGLPQFKVNKSDNFEERDKRLKLRQKRNFDRRTGAKIMVPLQNNDRVWVKTKEGDGSEGTVVEDAQEPDSYLVERNDNVIRRNRKHLTLLPSNNLLEAEADNTKRRG